MPYIPKEHRSRLSWWLQTDDLMPHNPGELNFVLTKILIRYIDNNGRNYSTFNSVMGVLSCIGHELYRRFIGPYEDKKIEKNGDVL